MSRIALRTVHQPGLHWENDLFGEIAKWTKEPSIDIMKKLITQHLELENEPKLDFFAAGALNKLYAFDCAKGSYLMRVVLPVAPGVKTESEVATLNFIPENTSIPVPRVIASDSNLQNELGFEWMIMERIDARPLLDVWHEMSWLKKELLVQQIANFSAQLFEVRLSGIGSIRSYHHQSEHHGEFHGHGCEIGEIVTPLYFIGDAVKLDIDRGPYNSGRTYLNACLDILRHMAATKLASDDEEDVELGEKMQEICESLATVIPRYFPHQSDREPTMLYHHDLSLMNILVDSEGNLSSIVDWECVVAVPAYQACELPEFLTGQPYALTDCPPALSADADADSIKYNRENIANYECGRLRGSFLKEMERISPQWMETFRQERVRHDIVLAVTYATQEMTLGPVRGWLGMMARGVVPKTSLTDASRSNEALFKADWVIGS